MGHPSTDTPPPENVNLPYDDDDDDCDDDANDANNEHHILCSLKHMKSLINQGEGMTYISATESSVWKTKPKLESYTCKQLYKDSDLIYN